MMNPEVGITLRVGDGAKAKLPSALRNVELAASFRVGVLLAAGGGRGNNSTAENGTAAASAAATAMLGADAARGAREDSPGLQYFDINATAGFSAGHDDITGGAIFTINASMSLSYPCTRPIR